jgi:tetratricopeptide (TPR) repeat protein
VIKALKSTLLGTSARILAAIAAVGVTAPIAQAVPLKVESENIVFYGDVDVKLAKERVRKWEIYRRMIYALSGVNNPEPDARKLTIYAFETGDELRDFTAMGGIAGVYTSGVEGHMFLTSVSNNRRSMVNGVNFSELVGLHEYTHHVTNSFVRQSFPRWYSEGFANYLSTMEITEDSIAIGSPNMPHLQAFKDNRVRWLSPERVLSSNAYYLNYTRPEWRRGGATSFYGQSTLYVHYMRSKPEMNAKLPEYLARLEDPGVTPVQAFEEIFEISPKKFHREATRYFRDNDFVINTYQPGPAMMDVKMTAKKLTEAELLKAQIAGRIAFMADDNLRDIQKDLKVVAGEKGETGIVTLGLVAADIQAEKYDTALARAVNAYNTNPSDIYAQRSYAAALYNSEIAPMLEAAEDQDDEVLLFDHTPELQKAMDLYTQILMDNPKDRDALGTMIQYYANSELPVTDVVFDAARIYDILYMDKFNFFDGLNLATIYAKRGYTLDACDYYQKALADTEDFKGRWAKPLKVRLKWFGEEYGSSCETA